MRNDFNPSFLPHFFPLPASLSILHRRTESLFKEVRKRRFNSVLQIKSTLEPCSSLYFVFVFFFFCHTNKLHDLIQLQKRYKNVESNGEEAEGGLKEAIKLMLTKPPQLQFFKDEIRITATDTIIIKRN